MARASEASTSEAIVQVRRGSYVESIHSFAACVVDADGTVLEAIGDVDRAFPIRSLAKPFIAAAFVRSGAVDAFGFGEIEIALSAGSHDGEPIHIDAVGAMLERLGSAASALECGPAVEGKIVVGPAVANNCSGKHAAILAMCRHYNLPTDSYIDPDHPLQKTLIPKLMIDFGRDPASTPLAIDGCGLPIFGATLRQIAHAYAQFGASNDHAARRVRSAMSARPEYVGGSHDNLDTTVISASGRRVLGKIGAEGLHADALLDSGIGIAVKILDGNSRALPPVLARLIGLQNGDGAWLKGLRTVVVYNAAGDAVGDVVAPLVSQ
jgi:L-asparaginase II